GLGEMLIETGIGSAFLVFLLSPPGHRNEDDAGTQTRADLTGRIIAIESGHADIEYRHIRSERDRRFNSHDAIMRRSNLVAGRLKHRGEHRGRVNIVVRNKDSKMCLVFTESNWPIGIRRLQWVRTQSGQAHGKDAAFSKTFTGCFDPTPVQLDEFP